MPDFDTVTDGIAYIIVIMGQNNKQTFETNVSQSVQ